MFGKTLAPDNSIYPNTLLSDVANTQGQYDFSVNQLVIRRQLVTKESLFSPVRENIPPLFYDTQHTISLMACFQLYKLIDLYWLKTCHKMQKIKYPQRTKYFQKPFFF